ncbi:Fur family transcriptional regulator [Cohnella sp. JJ-181]|uniref:Fur family transcriptional regulator n=1 Tax=Cohnella rhizoplanae TaxID=2974897 RepID=UPI0022FF9674|nr:transcriptional repressor [Cohnella sp. JJ-181]CAI6045291.1 Peroxide operon regulator [Cohnella sp. JJ-181]
MTKRNLTAPRKLVYDIVMRADDHPTAADIIDRLKSQGQSVAYATVYNSLRYLTDEGLIRELKLEGKTSRYDGRDEDHAHIVCASCGRVDEVMTPPPAEWLALVAEESGYALTEEQFIFRGECPACRTSKPKN